MYSNERSAMSLDIGYIFTICNLPEGDPNIGWLNDAAESQTWVSVVTDWRVTVADAFLRPLETESNLYNNIKNQFRCNLKIQIITPYTKPNIYDHNKSSVSDWINKAINQANRSSKQIYYKGWIKEIATTTLISKILSVRRPLLQSMK